MSLNMYSMTHPNHGVPPLPMTRGSSSSSSSQQPPPPPVASNGMVQNYPPPPQNVSCRGDGRIYTLEVKQQPIRARMCGFGDKVRSSAWKVRMRVPPSWSPTTTRNATENSTRVLTAYCRIDGQLRRLLASDWL